jgi:hypothetical protein
MQVDLYDFAATKKKVATLMNTKSTKGLPAIDGYF